MRRSFLAAAVCLHVRLRDRRLAGSRTDDEPVVLEVGDEAPEFEGLDDEGEEWKSIDHVGKKIVWSCTSTRPT